MSSESDKETVVLSWMNAFKRAADFDAWGQPVEAIDIYDRLSKQLHQSCDSHDVIFNESQRKTLEKIALCLDSREQALRSNVSHTFDSVPLADLRRLEQTFHTLLDETSSNSAADFPVDVTLASTHLSQLSMQSSLSKSSEGTLLPKPLPIPGKTLLSVTIKKIDLKDASQYLDPFITVSVRDSNAIPLSASQDTPSASRKTDSEIYFGKIVHIQKAVESLPPGFAIFFEFKHYKPKKKNISTKCWSIIEHDELNDGDIALEIYKKPTDYNRNSVRLLSIKPYYLHLHLSLFR